MKKTIKRKAVTLLISLIAAGAAVFAVSLVSACVKNDGDNIEKDAGSGGVVDESKWNVSNGLAVGFFSDEDCPQGNIDESKAKRELNSKLDERQYMVADFTIRAPQDNDGKQSVTAEVKISPASAASATVQETNTGNVSEETAEGITTIKAVYKIPDKAEAERKIRLVVRIDATDSELAGISLNLDCPDNMPAVSAKSFKKQMVMGYTEGLEFDGAKVTGINDKSAAKVVIPTEYGGTLIDGLGANAFENCTELKSVQIPYSIGSVDEEAFQGCDALERITVGEDNSAYSSQDGILYNKEKTQFVIVPNSVKGAVAIAEGVTSIESGVFLDRAELTGITIPNSVTEIAEGVFNSCTGLEAITVESENTEYKSENNCVLSKDGKTLIAGCKASEIPDGVTDIGNSAFLGCTVLTSITIPNGVENIGQNAFSYCDGLTEIIIPDTVVNIGYGAFLECKGLTTVTVSAGVQAIDYDAFRDCGALADLTVLSSATKIGTYAFYGCPVEKAVVPVGVLSDLDNSNLKTVVLTDSDSIPSGAFSGCGNLTSLTIPSSVTSIDARAFRGCTSLESVVIDGEDAEYKIDYNCLLSLDGKTLIASFKNGVIPNGVTDIGDYAFSACSGLTDITIPSGVERIGNGAFYGCSKLKSINIPATVVALGSTPFGGCTGLETITVESENTKYKSEGNCLLSNDGTTLIAGCKNSVIPESVTEIGNGAFHECSTLTSITIPNSVESINSHAFYGCRGLTSITIPDSVTVIGSAFVGCTGLTSITLPYVGNPGTNASYFGYIFGAASYRANSGSVPASLKTVVITGGTAIDDQAFFECKGLTGVTIPNTVTSIGFQAFYNCIGLKSIIIPDSVTTIGRYAFDGCSGIESISVGSKNTEFKSAGNCLLSKDGKGLILGCKNSVIPDGVIGIGENAFSCCTGLTNLTIPKSVTSIGAYAFISCTGLASLTYKGTLEQWYAVTTGDSWLMGVGRKVTVRCTNGDASYYG